MKDKSFKGWYQETSGLKVSVIVLLVPPLPSVNCCSQKASALACTVRSLITAWDWNGTASNIKTACFSNVSNSSCQRGYFLQPANIMTFIVELKGRFLVHFLAELWHFLYLLIVYISVWLFPLYLKFQKQHWDYYFGFILLLGEISGVLNYDKIT